MYMTESSSPYSCSLSLSNNSNHPASGLPVCPTIKPTLTYILSRNMYAPRGHYDVAPRSDPYEAKASKRPPSRPDSTTTLIHSKPHYIEGSSRSSGGWVRAYVFIVAPFVLATALVVVHHIFLTHLRGQVVSESSQFWFRNTSNALSMAVQLLLVFSALSALVHAVSALIDGSKLAVFVSHKICCNRYGSTLGAGRSP